MSIQGTWDLIIATPIGRIAGVLNLVEDGGELRGTAHGTGEEVELRDLHLDGDRLTWHQKITKPLRLNLAFTVTVNGDTIIGTSKAGRLPSSTVTGRRRLHHADDATS